MMKTALFLVCLVAVSTSFQMTKHQLPSLQAKGFGNIFAEIRAQIAAGGPLENISGLIDGLEDQINQEQADHKAILDANAAACEVEQNFRNAEIIEGNSAYNAAFVHHGACVNSNNHAQVDLEVTIQDLADTKVDLQNAINTRQSQYSEYEQKIEDHKIAKNVINGALNILDELTAGEAELIQLSQHSIRLIQTGVKINLAGVYAPAIAMLAQMATAETNMFVEPAAVQRVRELFEELLENVNKSLQDYNQIEADQKAAFAILKANLLDTIAKLESNQSRLELHIEEMEQCILEEQVVIERATEKVTRNTNLLNASVAMCEAFKAEFEVATDSRNEELELLVVVRQMVNKRLGGLGASVVERDDGFAAYEGAEFEEQTFGHANAGNQDDNLGLSL